MNCATANCWTLRCLLNAKASRSILNLTPLPVGQQWNWLCVVRLLDGEYIDIPIFEMKIHTAHKYFIHEECLFFPCNLQINLFYIVKSLKSVVGEDCGLHFLYGVVHLSLFFRYLGVHGALFGFIVWRVWFTKCVLLGVCIWIYVNEFSIALLGIAGDWCGAKWGIVVILKALIISSSEILETGSELNRTSSELIWRSSEENVTIGEIIWTWCQVVTK